MNKEIKALMREAQAAGWTVVKTTNGAQLRHPNGHGIVQLHRTSSCWRSMANLRRDMRAAARS